MPTIKKPNQYFDATTYTGNGGTLSVTNTGGFQPDMVWVKSRSNSGTNNLITDVARGNRGLFTNLTEGDSTGRYCTLLSNGFQFVGTAGDDGNTSGWTYVGWQWKAGGASTVNTSGSISSNVSVNTTAGFSVVTYTGSGAAGTVGHGLGVAPALIITKKRSNAGGGSAATNWVAWHKSLSGAYSSTTGYIYFNDSANASTTTNFYDGTAITSTTFRWQTGNDNINYSNDTFVSYCWSEVEGFSKFGSYAGNSSTDGPFVYTGFKPRWILIKKYAGGTASNWHLHDTARDTYNSSNSILIPDSSGAESVSSGFAIDMLSNGFKLRTSDGSTNGSTLSYIYAAFAESPFKYSNAR